MKGMSCPKECHYINYLFMIIYDQNQNFNRLSVNPEGAGAIAGNWQLAIAAIYCSGHCLTPQR